MRLYYNLMFVSNVRKMEWDILREDSMEEFVASFRIMPKLKTVIENDVVHGPSYP